jgi:uncharacterized protein with von Willebrand factor type A (vWA) domain
VRSEGTILYGIFSELLAAGMQLGIADYLEALRAVRMDLDGAIPGGGALSRERLRRICHLLWARRPDEHRLIDAVFRAVRPPSAGQVRTLEEAMGSIIGSSAVPEQPGGEPVTARAASESNQSLRARVSFEPSHGSGGIPLPRLAPVNGVQPFILQPQTVVSERILEVLWRRFRRLTRTGAKTELDVEGTIAERCRTGVLASPIMRARRTNRARLLLLLDDSPSMAPWQGFAGAVARSLTLSRLDRPGLFYFHNTPKGTFYRSPARAGAVSSADIVAEYANASMLVVSDAGAARGFLNHRRARETQAFLTEAKTRTRASVWLNPLPRSRWPGTTAERLARWGTASFLPLDVASLIRAVDILRGARSA